MKPRRVVVSVEMETDAPVEQIHKALHTWKMIFGRGESDGVTWRQPSWPVIVKQVQVNVIRHEKPRRGKR